MAKLSIGQKGDRVLTLLLALRNVRIAGTLARHGFTNADLQEGWTLLRSVTRTHLDAPIDEAPVDNDALQALDEWENKWFVITSATLQRRAPNVHDVLFRNLSQTEGVEVIVSVGTFLDRWDIIDKPVKDGGLGNDGKDAKKIMAIRGLTNAVIDEAKVLVEKLRRMDGPLLDVEKIAAEEANFDKAERELWAWYLEWSTIARNAIKQRSLLKKLGFLQDNGRGVDEDIDEDASGSKEPVST
jgi:hypothetical protein